MRSRPESNGLTLLEVVLSASIMAGVVALVLTGYARMASAAAAAREYGEAAELLQVKLHEIYGLADLKLLEVQGKFAETDDFETPLVDAAWHIETASLESGLARVDVIVTWRGSRGEGSVKASTLKFLPGELQGQSVKSQEQS